MRLQRYLALLFGLIVVACSSENDINPVNTELDLNFSHTVDGNPVQLDQLIYKNALNQDFSIKTVKYFISEIKLINEDKSLLELSEIIYVDIRTPESLNILLDSKIPKGDYIGISFVYGLTPTENVTGRFTQQPESLMEWPVPLGGGYHYAKIEGEYKTQNEENFFNFHSGMLNGTDYSILVELDKPFAVGGASLSFSINMEIQNWFTNPNDWDFAYFGPGIMGNPEAQKTVQENGQNVFSFNIIENL